MFVLSFYVLFNLSQARLFCCETKQFHMQIRGQKDAIATVRNLWINDDSWFWVKVQLSLSVEFAKNYKWDIKSLFVTVTGWQLNELNQWRFAKLCCNSLSARGLYGSGERIQISKFGCVSLARKLQSEGNPRCQMRLSNSSFVSWLSAVSFILKTRMRKKTPKVSHIVLCLVSFETCEHFSQLNIPCAM